VLADSLLDATKLILLRGGVFAGLPGAGSATDNAAVLGAGPLAVSAGGAVSVRFWLLAAADEAAAGARLAELRASAAPAPPPGGGNAFAVLPPFPNPMRVGEGTMRFPFTVSDAQASAGGELSFEVYDLSGRRLVRDRRTLSSGGTTPEFTWDGRLAGGVDAAAGVYLYVIRLGDEAASGRLVLVK
jgi:hypothetical protein